MARASLLVGGKYGTDIVFRGNKKYLPARIRGIISAYFNPWNALKDVASYPQLIQELGEAGADRVFAGTDWEKLNAVYTKQMERYTVLWEGEITPAGPRFSVSCPQGAPAKPLETLLKQYTDDGVLRDNNDLWQLDKHLIRRKAQARYDDSFQQALRRFATRTISFEESLGFYRQIQAYHMEQYLAAELKELLKPAIDSVHTLKQPTALPELVAALRKAGAEVRVHDSVAAVLAHYTRLAEAGVELAEGAKPAEGDPRVAGQLEGALKTQLYPFQREGVAFLTVNERALLADDMGLGKTLQAIAGALVLKRRKLIGRVLVVCPASLKYQWQAEIHRFTSERCEVIGGDKAEREAIYRAAEAGGSLIGEGDKPTFYVINYELVYRDIEALKKLAPDLLVIDEAQRIKNFRTKTYQAMFDVPHDYLFVLTGTPLENQLMELYTIMRFINPEALGRNPVAFRDRYVLTDRFGGITGYRHIEEVSRRIAAVTLRRTKQETLSQLPELVENEVRLSLTDIQRKIYKELRGQAREVLSESAWDAAGANNALTLVQRLREVCDTPELIDPQYTESQKLTEVASILEDQVGALDRQVIIFTQWTRMGEILKRELNKQGYDVSFLHGGLKPKERQLLVERFTEGEDRVFISTDAGGTGLNLQAASLVINYDLPFNPAKLNQRIARAHRLGQTETVFVLNLLCRQTVEERLMRILKEKQALFDDVFGEISDPSQARVGKQRSLRDLLRELVD